MVASEGNKDDAGVDKLGSVVMKKATNTCLLLNLCSKTCYRFSGRFNSSSGVCRLRPTGGASCRPLHTGGRVSQPAPHWWPRLTARAPPSARLAAGAPHAAASRLPSLTGSRVPPPEPRRVLCPQRSPFQRGTWSLLCILVPTYGRSKLG